MSATHPTEQPVPPEAPWLRRSPAKDRSFIADEEIRNSVYDGKPGYLIRVRLTSYRSLPLSCLDKIELKVDGESIPPQDITFILNGYSHTLDELPRLSHIWWFILDYADLFVSSSRPLSPGEHQVEATLVTIEPYMTVGRFPIFYTSDKRLSVAAGLQGR